jgi:hypothetical protein
MGKNRIIIASVILLGLLGVVVALVNRERAEDAAEPDVKVTLPAFDKDTIDELYFAAPNKPAVRHVKKDGKWMLVEPLEAPSDSASIKSALGKLDELEVTGVAATTKDNHGRLEVDAEKGTRVTAKAGGNTVLDLWVGIYKSGNSMLRKEGEDVVATVRGSIRFAFQKELRGWRDRTILSLNTDDMVALEVATAEGTLKFVKQDGAWAQAPGEKPIERFDPSLVDKIAASIATLKAADFPKTPISDEEAGMTEGKDAATVTVTLGGDAGQEGVVLRLGKTVATNRYLKHEGDPTMYLVANYLAANMTGGPSKFQKAEEQPEAPGAAAPQGMPPGMPPGMPGMPPGHPPAGMDQAQLQKMIQQAQQRQAAQK